MYYDLKNIREDVDKIVNQKLKNTFLILVTALIVTLATLLVVASNPTLLSMVVKSMFILVIVQLLLAMTLSIRIYKASKMSLLIMLYGYAILTGATLSILGAIYTFSSIIAVLGGTIVLFSILAIYGYTTKKDLITYSSMLTVGIISLVILTVVNIFLKNGFLELILSFAGVLIFMIYTAYDVNQIKKNINVIANQGNNDVLDRISIIGAFSLYLDFINLFLYLLRLFGSSKD